MHALLEKIIYKLPLYAQLKEHNEALSDQITQFEIRIAALRKQNEQLASINMSAQQQAQQALDKQNITLEQKIIAFEAKIDKECRARQNISIGEMNESNERLEQLIKDAITFDFPIHHENYDNLLKGREFEICLAKMLSKDTLRIHAWTPDKGIYNNIKVESNNHPDLIVKTIDNQKIAIECKFRSRIGSWLNDKEYPNHIILFNYAQYKAYERFKEAENMPVFIALGIGGNAQSPDNIYLINLDDIPEQAKYIEANIGSDKKISKLYIYHKKQLKNWDTRLIKPLEMLDY